MAKQAVTTKIYYNGQWNTVAAYTRDPIAITRGMQNEGSQTQPSSVTLTLDNRDGSKNPNNPTSPLFGVAGRNTPIRVEVGTAASPTTDTFNRTIASGGWGSADTGEAWSTSGAGGTVDAADFAVSPTNGGQHFVETDNAYRLTYLSTLSLRDVDVLVTLDTFISSVSGNDIEPANIYLRAQSLVDYYMARVTVDEVAEAISVRFFHSTLGALGVAQVVPDLVFTGVPLKIRTQIQDTRMRIKVWRASESEPTAWHGQVTDDTIDSAGFIAIRSGVASGNTNTKPIEFRYDDLTITDISNIRFEGEIASWKSRKTVDFDAAAGKGDAWVEIVANDVLRRLGQNAPPLRSPLTRAGLRGNSAAFGVSGAPIGYWPIEDESGATSAASAIPGMPPLSVRGDVKFGDVSEVPLGSAPLARFADSASRLVGVVPASAYRSTWVNTNGTIASFLFGLGPDELANAPLWAVQYEDSGGSTWAITASLSGTTDFDVAVARWPTGNPAASVILDNAIFAMDAVLDMAHMVHLTLDQSGANVTWNLKFSNPDAPGILAGTVNNITLGKIHRMQFDAAATLDRLSFGHVSLHDTTQILTSEMFNNTLGHAGDTVDERLARLCLEEGISFICRGTPTTTKRMGAQRIASLVDLFNDARDVDQGMLYGSRVSTALEYRPVADMYNQTAVLAMDLSDGIAPGLEPDIDDLNVKNDVEVKRHGGSSAHVTQATGPLSTQPPPDGVGLADDSITINAETDQQLLGVAYWRLALGTVDEPRYPKVTVDLDANPSLVDDVNKIDVGDLITLDGLPADDSPDQVRLQVLGYTEVVGSHRRQITFNCAPYSPFGVGVWDEDGVSGRYDSAYSTLDADFDAGTDTSMDVAVEAGRLLWVTGSSAPQFPLDILVSGSRLRVTAITGSSSPQTFTVTQAPVNGVVKSIPAGTPVRVWLPGRWAF